MPSFRHLKVGDIATRMLGGKLPMEMTVMEVRDDVVVCDTQHEGNFVGGDWQFDRDTGTEEDHELGWGVKFGVTGSYLVAQAPDLQPSLSLPVSHPDRYSDID